MNVFLVASELNTLSFKILSICIANVLLRCCNILIIISIIVCVSSNKEAVFE